MINPLEDRDADPPPVPKEMLEKGTKLLHHMLRAQGPIGADLDQPSQVRAAAGWMGLICGRQA